MSQNDAPATVQTGQTPQFRHPWYEIAEDADGRFHFALWTPNGRIVARSGCAYERRKDCIAAARSLAEVAGKATHIVCVTPG